MQEQSHFEVMEELGQLTIFDLAAEAEPEETTVPAASDLQLRVGDKIYCNVTEQDDAELYWYLYYYHPHVLKGEILEVTELLDKGNLIVRHKSETIYLNQQFVSL